MKKFYIALFMLVSSSIIIAQPWVQDLPQDKLQSGELKLQEIQKAFNDYWDPYNVEGGYFIDENGEKVKASGWKQFKRWEWKAKYLVDSDGNFPTTSTSEELDKYYKMFPDATKSLAGNWTNIGYNQTPGGYEGVGRVNTIAFHPSNTNIFWIGTPSGGMWKTTDGGSTWTVQTDGLSTMGVSAIAIPSDHATSNIVYIGTGDRDGYSTWTMGSGLYHDSEGIGVLKSTDGGTTWSTTALSFTQSSKVVVNDLLIHPTNNSIIYAATSNGLYKTTNGGTSWPKINTGGFIDLEFKPGSPTTMYGVRKIYSGEGSIWRSTDGGAGFSAISLSGSSSRRTELTVSAANSNYVYAITVKSNGGLEGIYQSTNSGISFTQVFNGSTAGNNLLGYYCNGAWATGYEGQGPYDLVLTANPANANEVYVGGINIWKTSDGGSTWSIKSMWSGDCGGTVTEVHADQHCCEFNGSTVYFGNDGGIYNSTNAGGSWTDISNGLTINQIYRIGVSQKTSNEAIIGLQDNGTHHLSGGSWNAYTVIGGDGMECLIDPTDDNIQFGEYTNGDIRRTTNHWSSKSSVRNLIRTATGATGSEDGAWVTPFMLDPNNRLNLFVGYDELWKSTDQGATSTNFSKLTVSSFSGPSDIKSIQIAPSNSNYIYVSYDSYWISTTFYPSSLHRSTDGGSTWTNITGSLPVSSGEITYICVKNNNHNTVWVTLGGFNSHAVYQTTNGGTGSPPTWTNISAGLPQIPAMSIVQNIQNTSATELYVSMSGGVWMKNGTSNWASFNSGLPALFCSELEIYYDNTSPSNSKIRIGTFGRGLWETPLPAVDFSANNTMPANFNTTVSFTDNSTNSPTGWFWSFNPSAPVTYGGGTNASSQNPLVRFGSPGPYTVTLTTTNTYGNNTHTKTAYIHMGIAGQWTGTTSTAWNTGTNWHNHLVPTASFWVTIDPGPTNWPIYNGNFVVGTQCSALSMSGNSEFTVQGDLTIPSGTQMLCAATSTINVDGDFINYGTFTPGTSVVKMNGSANSSLTGNFTASGNLTTSFNSGSSQMSNYFDIVASGGKSLTINSFDVNCNLYGNVSVEIWYTPTTYVGNQNNSGAWVKLGTTQTVIGQGTGNATSVNPGASVTIPSGSTYGFYISCYSGSNGFIVCSGGNSTFSNSDLTINCGDYGSTTQPGNGSVAGYSFNGTVYYSTTTQNTMPFYDLEINKSNASVTTNGDLNINNDFTIKPGAWFTNAPGNTVNVMGNTVFEADASGMASFIDNGTSTFVNNSPDIQMYLVDGRWHFIGMPVNSANAGVFHLPSGHSDIYLRTHDEATNTWNSWIGSVTTPLALGRGYETWVGQPWVGGFSQPETITFTGTLNTGDYTTGSGGFYGLQYTSTGGGHGLNMIANPYPSALQGNINTWSKSNLANSIWTWSKTFGNYVYWNGINGSGGGTGFGTMAGGVIPAMQGFFVEATGSNPSVTLPQTDRIHNSQAFYKESEIPSNTLRLEVNANDYKDIIFVTFNEQATETFDNNYDVRKLYGLEEAPQLYSLISEGQLSINALPELTGYRTVQLGFECGLPGDYSFVASGIESFNGLVSVYLEDTKEETLQNLMDNSVYSFTYNFFDEQTRFVLHFGNPNGIGDKTLSTLSIYSCGDMVYIQKPVGFEGQIRIYDILGQEIVSQKSTGEGLESIKVTNGTGYYLVKVQSGDKLYSEKVLIK